MVFLFIFSSSVRAVECPGNSTPFRHEKMNYSKVYLIPGAGAENDDLYLGKIRYGKYYSVYIRELKKRNIPYVVASTSPDGNEALLQRQVYLAEKIMREPKPVLLIGHSIGGLVARLALRDKNVSAHVAATVTISTPHRGTAIADWILTRESFPETARLLARAFGFDINQKEYIKEVSIEQKEKWDTALDHASHIRNVFSVVVAQTPEQLEKSNPLFKMGDKIIREETGISGEKVSDGLIHLSSQSWGECLLALSYNHGSVIGKDFFHLPSRGALPAILNRLDELGISFEKSK